MRPDTSRLRRRVESPTPPSSTSGAGEGEADAKVDRGRRGLGALMCTGSRGRWTEAESERARGKQDPITSSDVRHTRVLPGPRPTKSLLEPRRPSCTMDGRALDCGPRTRTRPWPYDYQTIDAYGRPCFRRSSAAEPGQQKAGRDPSMELRTPYAARKTARASPRQRLSTHPRTLHGRGESVHPHPAGPAAGEHVSMNGSAASGFRMRRSEEPHRRLQSDARPDYGVLRRGFYFIAGLPDRWRQP